MRACHAMTRSSVNHYYINNSVKLGNSSKRVANPLAVSRQIDPFF